MACEAGKVRSHVPHNASLYEGSSHLACEAGKVRSHVPHNAIIQKKEPGEKRLRKEPDVVAPGTEEQETRLAQRVTEPLTITTSDKVLDKDWLIGSSQQTMHHQRTYAARTTKSKNYSERSEARDGHNNTKTEGRRIAQKAILIRSLTGALLASS